MMDYKKLNMALFITVIVLITVAVFAFLKVLFSDTKALEWGSISDFISSISTFGTLLVAFFAYKAAPQWVKQKQYDEGINHVKSLMAEYDEIVSSILELHPEIITINKQSPKFKILSEKVEQLIYRTFDLRAKLKSCQRWNIIYPKEVSEAFLRLTMYFHHSFLQLTFSDIDFSDERANEIDTANLIIAEVKEDIDFFNRSLDKFFTYPK